MILNRKSIIQFLFFLFLFLHALPLLFNQQYELIIQLNYSIILLSLIISTFFNKKMSIISIVLILLIILSVSMSILGFSGTISSLIMAASLPHFFFSAVHSKKDFLKICYKPIIFFAISLIFFSINLYSNVINFLSNPIYLGQYFGIASINYVPIVISSSSILVYLLINQKNNDYNLKNFNTLILLILIFLSIFFSFIFTTRVIFFCSFILLYTYFERFKIILFPVFTITLFYNIDIISITFFELFGTFDLRILVTDYSRIDSILNLINSSLSNYFYNFDFRNQMSYSSIINLLFSMFPFTFIFLHHLFKTAITIFNSNSLSLFFIFICSFAVTLFQMDFFSVFVLFFFMEYVNFSYNNYAD